MVYAMLLICAVLFWYYFDFSFHSYCMCSCDATVIYGQAISARLCLAVLLSRPCLDCDYCVYV